MQMRYITLGKTKNFYFGQFSIKGLGGYKVTQMIEGNIHARIKENYKLGEFAYLRLVSRTIVYLWVRLRSRAFTTWRDCIPLPSDLSADEPVTGLRQYGMDLYS